MNKVYYDKFVYFRLTWYSQVTFIFAFASVCSVEHFLLIRKKYNCEDCGKETTRSNCARYTKKWYRFELCTALNNSNTQQILRMNAFQFFFFVANLLFKYDPALFFQNSFPTINPV